MCGISGILDTGTGRRQEALTTAARRMATALAHRGPDDEGVWVDAEAGIALGFRRLSILDLSSEGHQPMHSACGRYTIVFNGEVYNFSELRNDIAQSGRFPFPYKGHSDTEVLLAAFTSWGVVETLPRLNGMFAMAVWDHKRRTLLLARDRVGKKPLYYGWQSSAFVFGSELKALRRHPSFNPEIDRSSLGLYFRYSYVPAPFTIYEGIRKLLPGHYALVEANGLEPAVKSYWSARGALEAAKAGPFEGSDKDAIDELDKLLRDSVRLRMVADVPLGAFLSGGVDSSLIVALMQAQTTTRAKTFTIGFSEKSFNEAPFARDVARHLGTDHTELCVSPRDAMAIIPRMPAIYDEPFADSSQIPTFLVAGLARGEVAVSLSGDGGDELFGGYNRYFVGRSLWHGLQSVPVPARRAAAALITSVSPRGWDVLAARTKYLLPRRFAVSQPGDKVHKAAKVLVSGDPATMYRGLVSHWGNPDEIVIGAAERPSRVEDEAGLFGLMDFTDVMMFLDFITYLPDDILVKLDRATMAVSLEARAPLLDYRIVEFAWRLPLAMKIRNGSGKWVLRQLLDRYVPRHLIERPKAGFGIPLGAWLRGPLRDWAESLLDPQRVRAEGLLAEAEVSRKWREHISSAKNWQHYLWDVLMFQAWLEDSR